MRVGLIWILMCCLVLTGPALVYAQEDEPPAPTPTPEPAPEPAPPPAQREGLPDDVITPETPPAKPKINNLPFNLSGLSGMMVTTSTRTLRPGSFEVGLGGLWENSYKPRYYRREATFLGTVGIPAGFEFGLRVPYVMTDLYVVRSFNVFGALEREYKQDAIAGIGTVEGMFKWGFVEQHLFLPAFAMGLGFMAPTGDYTREIGEVKYYGFKVLLAMGLEINDLPFTDYAFAIMADGVLVLRDVGIEDRDYEEKHGIVHGGFVFPLLSRNFLQLLTEYEGVLMMGTTNKTDTHAMIGSLRFVTAHFNVTAGAKYTFKADPDFGEALGYVATFSYTYF